jgi:NADH-quinone oxidoreductase subunit I
MKGLLKGLGTTLSTFARKPVTIQYPDKHHPLPVRQRSFPVLTWDFDQDEPACTGCNICVRNCPVDCMTAIMHDNPKYTEGTSDRRKIVEKFWIDYARCMRCNICVEVCPFEAIVMDNNWSGHEHSVYDRLDLHMDIDELTKANREGKLTLLFQPEDTVEALIAEISGGEAPEVPFKASLPEARARHLERIAKGEPAAIQLREPEKPKVAAPTAAAAGGAEVEVLSESKIRAKRMRAERQAKEYTDKGEAVPAEILAAIELYRNMKPGEAAPAEGAGAAAGAAIPRGEFPPGIGIGPKGDPNSPEKVRARRMRAERKAKEATAAGEPIPEDVAQTLYDLGSEMSPGGGVWATLGGGTAVAAAPAEAPSAAPEFPPGIGIGPKGDPNSPEKVRARRMRAERQAKEAMAKGETIPDEVLATIKELGGKVPEGAAQ